MMNEERLKRILDAEQKAQAFYELAVMEAKSLPEQAEIVVKTMLDKTKQDAELEGEQLIDRICNPKEIEMIVTQYAERAKHRDELAQLNMPKAIDFVIKELLGKEDSQ